MNSLVANNRNEINRLCRKHCVQRLELFGSAACESPDARTNDLDFLVQFEPMPPVQHADCFFHLQAELEELLGLPIDLVEPEPIRNPYFRQALEQTSVLIYAAA